MGVVYEAEDIRLRRRVAIKLLPADSVPDANAIGRFQREAEAASALNHPNICTIYDVGEHDGRPFIVMEKLEGRTLKDLIGGKPLPLDQLVSIGREVSDALASAHAAGIIHRDIKPQNIFITTRGAAKLLDFGLARLERRSAATDPDSATVPAPEDLTTPGTTLGTIAYMSPEQARGEPVDVRSDLFSLGAVLYEMATGAPPFRGATPGVIFDGILNHAPPPPSALNGDVPPALDRLILDALEKDRDCRIQTATDLRAQLVRLQRGSSGGSMVAAEMTSSRRERRRRSMAGVAAGVVAVTIALAMWLLATRRATARNDRIDSVAVLPFANAGRSLETEYLSDGITESIINNLSRNPSLRVVPRTTAFRYKGKEVDLRRIADELNVRAIVSGRVLQRGDTLTVQAELIDTAEDAQLWGARYERNVSGALALQEVISDNIAAKLSDRQRGEPQESTHPMTADPEAYHLYLKGRHQWNRRTGEALRQALAFFESAVARDPKFALAHLGIADTYVVMEQYTDEPATQLLRKAEAAARTALAADPSLAEAHAALGLIHHNSWEWERAGAEFRTAIALKPNYATAHHWYSLHLGSLRRLPESLAEARRAQQLDPMSMIIGVVVFSRLAAAGSMDEALRTAEHYRKIDPDYPLLLTRVSRTYSDIGRHDDAVAFAKRGAELGGGTTEQLCYLGRALALAGARDGAIAVLRRVEKRMAEGEGDPVHVAVVRAALGDGDGAFQALDRAYAQKSTRLAFIHYDDLFGRLAPDPRYRELLRKLRLI